MLVSIIIITYNSADYVLETLESAYRQTYQEIELIVSDDCSTDNTFALCQQWKETHQGRFVRTLCTQTPHNGGIVWNYNHALQRAQGKWIKYIAGDDILHDNCIERCVANIRPRVYLYTCSYVAYAFRSKQSVIELTTMVDGTAWQQMRDALRHRNCAHGCSLFLERAHLLAIGGYDMRFPMVEDVAIVYQYLLHGLKVGIVDETLVTWRVYEESVSKSTPNYSKQVQQCFDYFTLRYPWRYGLLLHQYYYWVGHWINKHYERGTAYKIIGYFLQCFNVVHIYRKLAKR